MKFLHCFSKKFCLSELQKADMERKPEKRLDEILLEDEVDLYNEGIMIEVRVSDDESYIEIGKYKISAFNFGDMIMHLANGGFMGFMDDQKPEFGEPILEAIKNSKRRLYKEIHKKL